MIIPGNTNIRGNLNVGSMKNDDSYISIGMNGDGDGTGTGTGTDTGTKYRIKNLKDEITNNHSFQVSSNIGDNSTPILNIENGSSIESTASSFQVTNNSTTTPTPILNINSGWSIDTSADGKGLLFKKDGTTKFTISEDTNINDKITQAYDQGSLGVTNAANAHGRANTAHDHAETAHLRLNTHQHRYKNKNGDNKTTF